MVERSHNCFAAQTKSISQDLFLLRKPALQVRKIIFKVRILLGMYVVYFQKIGKLKQS